MTVSHPRACIVASLALAVTLSGAATAQELRFGRVPENALAYLYNTRGVEFAVCLYGTAQPDVVSVNRVAFTFIGSYSASTVSAEACPAENGLLGMAHSHPDGDCRFSAADVAAFLARTDHPFDFVVCENNQVNWMNRAEATALQPAARAAPPRADAAELRGVRLREMKIVELTDKPR